MESSDEHEIVRPPNQFATDDSSEAGALKAKIVAGLKDRIPGLKDVHVTVYGSTSVLRGRLLSAQEKRLCLEYCRSVPGVVKIIDELIVSDEKTVHIDPDDDSV